MLQGFHVLVISLSLLTVTGSEDVKPEPTSVPDPNAVVGFCPERSTWSSWINSDDGTDGDDNELYFFLRRKHNLCRKPTAVEVRIFDDKSPYHRSRNVLRIAPTYGVHCRKREQPFPKTKPCMDYEIRFCCPSGKIGDCSSATSSWSEWEDRDDASNMGDIEKRIFFPCVCDGNVPIAIEASLAKRPYLPYEHGENIVNIDANLGFSCLESEQVHLKVKEGSSRCQDYRVRFCCDANATPNSLDESKLCKRTGPEVLVNKSR